MLAAPGTLNLDGTHTWGSRSIDEFERLEQIGEGTYGQVFMAREKGTGEIVALKKVRMDNEKEGFPITAIREIKILKKLKHKNIVNLKEIVTSKAEATNRFKGSIYMVFEYMDHDLTGLSERPGMRFSVPQIKCYMKQLLEGLHYCHVNNVLHRDIKGSNLLINNEGVLKLADFGLARSFSSDPKAQLTNRVITLWYRPPELLMGAVQYGPAVDLWSVGCIFAELLTGKAILPGKTEIEQLSLIFQLCGTPDSSSWPECASLPYFKAHKIERVVKRRLREVFRTIDKFALDLLDKMLMLNPEHRIKAKDALDHEYFWQEPLPCDPSSLPKYESSHEYQTKKRRQEQRRLAEEKRQRLASGAAGAPPAAAGAVGGPSGSAAGGLYPQGAAGASSHLPPHPYGRPPPRVDGRAAAPHGSFPPPSYPRAVAGGSGRMLPPGGAGGRGGGYGAPGGDRAGAPRDGGGGYGRSGGYGGEGQGGRSGGGAYGSYGDAPRGPYDGDRGGRGDYGERRSDGAGYGRPPLPPQSRQGYGDMHPPRDRKGASGSAHGYGHSDGDGDSPRKGDDYRRHSHY